MIIHNVFDMNRKTGQNRMFIVKLPVSHISTIGRFKSFLVIKGLKYEVEGALYFHCNAPDNKFHTGVKLVSEAYFQKHSIPQQTYVADDDQIIKIYDEQEEMKKPAVNIVFRTTDPVFVQQ